PEHEHHSVGNGRCAAGAPAPIVVEERGKLRGPHLLACGRVEADQEFALVLAGAEGVEAVADNGWAGIAAAGVLAGPQELRAARWPVLDQARLFGDIVPVRAAPLRPC